MNIRQQTVDLAHIVFRRGILFVAAATAISFSCWAAAGETEPEPAEEVQVPAMPAGPTHMSEELRSSIRKVVVLPARSPSDSGIAGSYQKETAGLYDGAAAGSRIGTGVWTEVGGIPVGIPIPILTIPGAIIGGLTGATRRQIQELRDALTEDLAKAANQPLTNDALASDVFWSIRNVPSLDPKVFALSTPIPEDTEAILYVALTDLTINVDGKEAIITTVAEATLRRMSDGEHLFEEEIKYEDRDTLSNWTRDDSALWRDYANFARHYIGREISAQVFDRVELEHELRPQETDTVDRIKKNDWQGITRSLTPTLAWELSLLGGDSYGDWTNAIDETSVSYDVEIYDMHQLVYAAQRVPEPRHSVAHGLEGCKTYRWSVRPSYQVGSDIKFGEWMRYSSDTFVPKANVGRQVSAAPAYIQDFASLKVKCGSK